MSTYRGYEAAQAAYDAMEPPEFYDEPQEYEPSSKEQAAERALSAPIDACNVKSQYIAGGIAIALADYMTRAGLNDPASVDLRRALNEFFDASCYYLEAE